MIEKFNLHKQAILDLKPTERHWVMGQDFDQLWTCGIDGEVLEVHHLNCETLEILHLGQVSKATLRQIEMVEIPEANNGKV